MTAQIEIRPATFRDALILPLHRDDAAEATALGRNPREAFVESVEKSSEAWTGLADGELVCSFGVVPFSLVGVTGVPWLLGSPLVQQHGRIFLRLNRQYVARGQQYPILRNVVHARHRRAVRWLRWLGFTLDPAVALPPLGEPFHHFHMETP